VVKNIITRLPLTELVYENSNKFIEELGTLHKGVSLTREDFFAATISINEMNIIVSSNMASKVMRHFKTKPKIVNNNFAAVGISLDTESFNTPNTFFSLLSVLARTRINIEELVSTSTELIFIIAEKDFSTTVNLFSKLYKE